MNVGITRFQALAFRDVRPVAPSHFLVIPKNRLGLTGIRKATLGHVGLLGHLLYVASHVASKDPHLTDGYRIVINDGKHGGKKLSLTFNNALQVNLCIIYIYM